MTGHGSGNSMECKEMRRICPDRDGKMPGVIIFYNNTGTVSDATSCTPMCNKLHWEVASHISISPARCRHCHFLRVCRYATRSHRYSGRTTRSRTGACPTPVSMAACREAGAICSLVRSVGTG